MSTDAFNPLTHLRRLRQAQYLRRGSGHVLPSWALAEVDLSAAQAAWLLRAVCGWHALPARGLNVTGSGAVPLVDLVARLADHGVLLGACRVADLRALHRGDVVMLGDEIAERLFGGPAIAGGGLALVIDAGAQVLRLSPALAPDPLSCRVAELQAGWPGWVLRSRLRSDIQRAAAAWSASAAAAAV
jgi:hypothetical protein